MNIGEKLKTLREYYGYNQTELAGILDTSQRNISNYESSSEVTGLLAYIIKFCDYFNIPVSELFIDNIRDIKNTIPGFITPEDALLLKFINTKMDEETKVEIKTAFKYIVKAVAGRSEKLKNLPEYKNLYEEKN